MGIQRSVGRRYGLWHQLCFCAMAALFWAREVTAVALLKLHSSPCSLDFLLFSFYAKENHLHFYQKSRF